MALLCSTQGFLKNVSEHVIYKACRHALCGRYRIFIDRDRRGISPVIHAATIVRVVVLHNPRWTSGDRRPVVRGVLAIFNSSAAILFDFRSDTIDDISLRIVRGVF